MQTNWRNYTSDDSDARLVDILDAPSGAYETVDSIPDRARLTYANGFYVNCTAVFIDIRGSSDLTTLHKTPVLGKIYRSYISECVALLNTSRQCREIFIAGDCVSGIFDTPLKSNVDEAFFAAASLNSLIEHLNWRLNKKGYTPIKCGVGISYGRALMLKSGYTGSGINDVVWMGDVVNDASNLCHKGNKDGNLAVQVASIVHQNLCDEYQKLLHAVTPSIFQPPTHYQGDVINIGMRNWLADKQRAAINPLSLALFGFSNLDQPPPQTLLGMLDQPKK
jgi:class 3 adenylate cyclase